MGETCTHADCFLPFAPPDIADFEILWPHLNVSNVQAFPYSRCNKITTVDDDSFKGQILKEKAKG